MLYAFRSPGGVRVGRDPFESSVRREIEAGNPGIVFDWDGLVSGQHVIDSTPDQRRPRRRSSGGGEAPPPPTPPRRAEPAPQSPRLVVPGAIEGDTPETRLRFLAHWHGILCEQLPQRVADPARREALLDIAQRLNPAGWIDADEIATGLQGAAEALEQLSRAFSKRRRKPRRGGQRDTQAGAAEAPAGTAGESPDQLDVETESATADGIDDAPQLEAEPERESAPVSESEPALDSESE